MPGHVISRRKDANPEITADMLRALPKADLHCRLDGSVSIDTLWKEIQDDKSIDVKSLAGREFETKEELAEFLGKAEAKRETDSAKDITKMALQNAGQISRAVEDILVHAKEEGVKYLELVVRPQAHTLKGMSPAGVMDVVCSRTKEVSEKLGMYAGVIVYVSAVADDPISFNEMANLAVNYRQNDSMVVGFGIYGDSPIPSDSFRYFKKTFDLLKSHNINIAMVAGIDTVDTIMTAIQEGGASRLSGCFQVHTFPRLMDYMASYGIPVEVSMTDKLRRFTKDASFGGNAIRLLLDNEVPVAICSFRALFQDKNRVEMLEEIIKECHLSIPDTVKLLSTGFNFNFQNSIRQRKILNEFWAETQKVLLEHGVQDMFDVPFFP